MYGQKEDKTLFFVNVATALRPSSHLGDRTGVFSGSEESSRGRASPEDRRNAKTAT